MEGALTSIGGFGELLDVEELQKKWAESGEFIVCPRELPTFFHLLLAAAGQGPAFEQGQGGHGNVQTVEDAMRILAKLSELVNAVWPAVKPEKYDYLTYGRANIRVPISIR
jgi:hypothetical protein